MVPLIVPNAKVCPSALHAEDIIFSLYFYFGIYFLPGMYRVKSEAPPLKSSCVIGLNERVRIGSF
jgi:hypothetical protein